MLVLSETHQICLDYRLITEDYKLATFWVFSHLGMYADFALCQI